MRSTTLRFAGAPAVCLLVLSFTGCGSNNTGKIVGKWKLVPAAPRGVDSDASKTAGVRSVYEFKADGTYSVTFVEADSSPASKKQAEALNLLSKGTNGSGKYTLQGGDRVHFSGGRWNGNFLVTIHGTSMTVQDGGETMQFTRMN
jgi:hypothetical protein